jgi:hypothetical protein
MALAVSASKNVVLVLPKNTDQQKIIQVCKLLGTPYSIQLIFTGRKAKVLAVFIGHIFQS